jgi:hypothetical protein
MAKTPKFTNPINIDNLKSQNKMVRGKSSWHPNTSTENVLIIAYEFLYI